MCDKAHALLRQRVEPLLLKTANSKPYKDVAVPVADALAAMKWLVGYDCNSDAESLAWETMAKAYTNTNFDVYELAELRDPKTWERRCASIRKIFHAHAQGAFARLARLCRQKANFTTRRWPARASLTTAPPMRWEMLNDKYDISAPWKILKYLPVLDLETTAPLCGAALPQIMATLRKRCGRKPMTRGPIANCSIGSGLMNH